MDQRPNVSTLVALLSERAALTPDRNAFTFLEDGETEVSHHSFATLHDRARAIGAHLQTLQLSKKHALLLYPPDLTFLDAFFGSLYAGCVAIPAFPPDPSRLFRTLPRLQAILRDAQAGVVLTTRLIYSLFENILSSLSPDGQELQWIITDEIPPLATDSWQFPNLKGDSLAFLQYTSGSTGEPRGVMLSHANLLANLLWGQSPALDPWDINVNWLPLYHDMGLIGNVLEPIWAGCLSILMSPLDFLRRPARWVQAISRYKATMSGGPNFAYDLVVRKTSALERDQLDLSSWRAAYNGAEPIHPLALERFIDFFSPAGFRRQTFFTCYGLAEATLIVTGTPGEETFRLLHLHRPDLDQGRVSLVPAGAPNSITFASSGRDLLGQDIAIVDPKTRQKCQSREVGEIWVSGPCVSRGYWLKPELNREVFGALFHSEHGDSNPTFLRTGDLGFIHEGLLYVTGRIKDLIIRSGRNLYPQDLEHSIEIAHPLCRIGCTVAFSVFDSTPEQLVVVAEVNPPSAASDYLTIIDAIQAALLRDHDVVADAIALVAPKSMSKTSSGKLQRHQCRQAFLEGSLELVHLWQCSSAPSASFDVNEASASASIKTAMHAKVLTSLDIQTWIVASVSRLRQLAPGQIDLDESFSRWGIGSIEGVELSAQLGQFLGKDLPTSLLIEFPTINRLVHHLAGTEAKPQPPGPVEVWEPLAIIGMACDFPGGANSPEQFWRVLRDGVDTVTQVPPARWDLEALYHPDPDHPGTMAIRHGAFINDVDQFDAGFFGISPREAAAMDPQQRRLLEVTWWAFEDAHLALDQHLADVGVFVGLSNVDYSRLRCRLEPLSELDAYAGTGLSSSVASGRIAYSFGFEGPCMTLDTACSSSLVAVDLACRALLSGECTVAVAGGVNLNLAPDPAVVFSKARMMSPDGQCRTFDAAANGYVRGEGCGLIVLKRLSIAQKHGNHIHALIRGSAVNQGGRSGGLTVPSATAQQAVIRRALHHSGILPEAVSYVEAHGTGTPLGDPIEMRSLGAVYGTAARTAPLSVASVKTNVGHLEGAAGIAGLLKLVLMLKHHQIPPHLHLSTLNPQIKLDELRITIPKTLQLWDSRPPRLAGVNSFGFSGTNAHVVLEEAPDQLPAAPLPDDRASVLAKQNFVLPISARSQRSLNQLVLSYEQLVSRADHITLNDLCFSAARGRAHLPYRSAITSNSLDQLAERLLSLQGSETPAGVYSGHRSKRAPKIAFLFTGQGSQLPAMGKELFTTRPKFREILLKCDDLTIQRLTRGGSAPSLLEVLFDPKHATLLDRTDYTQPALFALEYALAELWKSLGIVPDFALGHSIGELVAACVAEVLPLEDALFMTVERSLRMQQLTGDGAMATVFASETDVLPHIARFSHAVGIAAINGLDSVVVSGERGILESALSAMERRGIPAKRLAVSQAFHSPIVDPMLEAFEQAIRPLSFHSPLFPLISTVTGRLHQQFDAAYWRRQIREPVQFHAAARSLLQTDCQIMLEIGPQAMLTSLGRRLAPEGRGQWLSTLRRGRSDDEQFTETLASLYAAGCDIQWQNAYPYGRRVSLPLYPFDRSRYWIRDRYWKTDATGPSVPDQTVLNRDLILRQAKFEKCIRLKDTPYLSDHRVFGQIVLPAAFILQQAVTLAVQLYGDNWRTVEDVEFLRPLIFDRSSPTSVTEELKLEFHVDRVETSVGQLDIYVVSSGEKVLAARLRLRESSDSPQIDAEVLAQLEPLPEPNRERSRTFYQALKARGLDYGPAFCTLAAVDASNNVAVGRLLSPTKEPEAVGTTQLDGAFHALAGLVSDPSISGVYLPIYVRQCVIPGRINSDARVYVRVGRKQGDFLEADVLLLDASHRVIARLSGVGLKHVRRQDFVRQYGRIDSLLYRIGWKHLPVHELTTRAAPIVIFDPGPTVQCHGQALADCLEAELDARGHSCLRLLPSTSTDSSLYRSTGRLDPASCEDYLRFFARQHAETHHSSPILVWLWSLNEEVESLSYRASLAFIHAILRCPTMQRPRVLLVSSMAQNIPSRISASESSEIVSSGLWGLGRVLMNEHPEVDWILVDLEDDQRVPIENELADAILAEDCENQLAFLRGERQVARLERAAPLAASGLPLGGAYRLARPASLSISDIQPEPLVRRQPERHEIEIQVWTTGLNFRDVLNVMGLYPGDAGPLGGECAGIVTAVGEDVGNLTVGDRVMGIAAGCFSAYATAPSLLFSRIPASLTFEEAATVPIAFLTAWYALVQLGGIQSGDRILIHSASGGVGLAAVQIAKAFGAVVIGTAGTAAKREILQVHGLDLILPSRSLKFAEVIPQHFPDGIDLVLNSLPGDYIPLSLRLLRNGGRFLEMGKVDSWTDAQVKAVAPHVGYFKIALDDLCAQEPQWVHDLLHSVTERFQRGLFQPLQRTTFDINEARDAFRLMGQSRHIGKIVVRHPHESARAMLFHNHRTYLLTGGTGAIALEMLEWMLEQGARHFVLLARRVPSDLVEARLDRLRANGAHIVAFSVDIGDRQALQTTLKQILLDMPPLRGVFHLAGVLHDALVVNQTPQSFDDVIRPKLSGAVHLDALTSHLPLDHFVLFSSVAAVLGSPGQANYASANALVHSIAQRRKARGLPTTVIDWGAWTLGMAGIDDVQRSLLKRGIRPIEPERAWVVLEDLLLRQSADLIVADIDWSKLLETANPDWPLLEALKKDLGPERKEVADKVAPASQLGTSGTSEFLIKLRAASREEQRALIVQTLTQQVLRVLRLDATHRIDVHEPLSDLGLDSLMAVELKTSVEKLLGQKFPNVVLLHYPTIDAFAGYLQEILENTTSTAHQTTRSG